MPTLKLDDLFGFRLIAATAEQTSREHQAPVPGETPDNLGILSIITPKVTFQVGSETPVTIRPQPSAITGETPPDITPQPSAVSTKLGGVGVGGETAPGRPAAHPRV